MNETKYAPIFYTLYNRPQLPAFLKHTKCKKIGAHSVSLTIPLFVYHL